MKTNICSFYKDGLIQVHQRGGDVGKTYKQKKLQTCKWELSSSGDGCSTKQRTQSDKLLTWDQICFFGMTDVENSILRQISCSPSFL